MRLVVPGERLGQTFKGLLEYKVLFIPPMKVEYYYSSTALDITVIPRCPSMLTTPQQYATANQNININLAPYVQYYDDNSKFNTPAKLTVTPEPKDGLSYDPNTLSIVGIPKRLGNYAFTISAHNDRCQTEPTTLNIMVQANIKDKPVFKAEPTIVTAVPRQKYSMNLMELLEQTPGFMINNQVQFRIDTNQPHPDWLNISPTDGTLLEGVVHEQHAGQTVQVTLIASTNTGGDSINPLTLNIPIAYDLTKKPTVNEFTLHQKAGSELYYDIAKHVKTPGATPYTLIIDKTEPRVDWITHDQNILKIQAPIDATGEKINITLRVSTQDGGPSEPITIPLQVDIDPEMTPYFKDSDLSLPMAAAGHPYFFDFFENNAVYPDNIPYQIEWADEARYVHPGWIELKNNQLIVNEVPEMDAFEVPLFVTIKNIPGGVSKVKEIDLYIRSLKTKNSIRKPS
jgi:hypothetical protein